MALCAALPVAVLLAASGAAAQDQPFFSDEMAVEFENANPVAGGVGFAYGMTSREARRACREQGHAFRPNGGGNFRCTGTAARQPHPATTVLRFCRGRLCEVDVLIPLQERNRGVQNWMVWYRGIRRSMESRYGSATNATAGPQRCLENGSAIARCVIDREAHVSAQWFPENGGLVSLHLVSIDSLGPHIRVTYAAAVRTGESDDPPDRPTRLAIRGLPRGDLPF